MVKSSVFSLEDKLLAQREKYRIAVMKFIQTVLTANKTFLTQQSLYQLGFIDEKGAKEREVRIGKMFRSMLFLAALEGLGEKKWRSYVPLAAAIELFHNGTLIVDDWQDKDVLRRGRTALWAREDIGSHQAINVGLFLIVLSSELMSKQRNIDPKILNALQTLFEKTKLIVVDGQQRDIAFEKRLDVSLEDYMDMITKKTAVLFSMPLDMAGLLLHVDKEIARDLHALGKQLGILFQLQDDYLGTFGQTFQTGKPLNDIAHRKKTYPILLTHQLASTNDRKRLEALYKKTTRYLPSADVVTIYQLLHEYGIKEKSQQHAKDMQRKVGNAVHKIEKRHAGFAAVFSSLLQSLISREK